MKAIMIILLILLSLQGQTQTNADLQEPLEGGKAYAQAYEYYKKEQFESSIAVLQQLKSESSLTPSSYYLLGLNYYRINNYDLASRYLAEVTQMNTIREISLAYYYLGLSQYYQGHYEKAVNSFELSIDTSKDAEHDSRTIF